MSSMKIIVQKSSIQNTSNNPELNKPFLNQLDSQFQIDDAEIIIRSKNNKTPNMIIANDGTLVFIEKINYSKDGSSFATGYTVHGDITLEET